MVKVHPTPAAPSWRGAGEKTRKDVVGGDRACEAPFRLVSGEGSGDEDEPAGVGGGTAAMTGSEAFAGLPTSVWGAMAIPSLSRGYREGATAASARCPPFGLVRPGRFSFP